MKANLYKAYQVGRIVNLQGKAFRIIAETGKTFDCLPGGSGIREVELVQVVDKPLTLGEIKQLSS